MARQYAQITTAIWRNEGFTALPHDEQWLYLLLNTQPDISAAGVLTLAVKRWSGRSANMTPAMINRLLDNLAAKRFLILDRDLDEVLVRSFIRWDRGYANPKRQPSIRDAIDAVESPAILAAIAGELGRLGMPVQFWGRARPDADDVTAATSSETPDDVPPVAASNPAFPQVNRLSDSIRCPNESGQHTDGAEERRVPQPTTHNPQPTTPKSKPLINAARRSQADQALIPVDGMDLIHADSVDRAKRDRQFDEFWAAYPRKVGKQGARRMWETKIRGTRTNPGADPQAITAGAIAFGEHTRNTATPIDKIPHPQTWLNRGSWEDELPTGTELVVAGIPAQATHLADGRHLHARTADHLDHLSRYGDIDA